MNKKVGTLTNMEGKALTQETTGQQLLEMAPTLPLPRTEVVIVLGRRLDRLPCRQHRVRVINRSTVGK